MTLSLDPVVAQGPSEANYDESKVGAYTLVDPTEGFDVTTWPTEGRQKWLDLLAREMFGRMPGPPADLKAEVVSDGPALDGAARRKIVRLTPVAADGRTGPPIEVLIYLPAKAVRPVGMFVGLNFQGNHTVTTDPGVPLATTWSRPGGGKPAQPSPGTEEERGKQASRWPVDLVVGRGYGVATAYYGDIDPDFDDGFSNGVHGVFDPPEARTPEGAKDGNAVHPGRAGDAWGSIAGWAWGLSRIADYLVTDEAVDPRKLIVTGHSRLGKTSLWAGATDPRFSIVISNNSGCGGAALSKRKFGETVHRINTSFPHWFCDNFKAYNGQEEKLPFDQHVLIGLIAPRPVFVSSAVEDRWADPRGEFLAAKAAAPIYEVAGVRDAFPAEQWPPVNVTAAGTIGYRLRDGAHDVRPDDWQAWLDFADQHLGKPDAAGGAR